MRRPPVAAISVALLLALGGAACALVVQFDREEVGPAEGRARPMHAGPESAFRLSPLRCYWRETGFDGSGMSR